MIKNKKIANTIILSVLLCMTLVGGCDNKKQAQQTQEKKTIIIAKKQSSVTNLYFQGVVNPIRSIPVFSPVDGNIARVLFTYGQSVKKGQKLAVLDSTPLAVAFQKAVTDYLQKKDAYENQLISYAGDQALYKAGVISKNTFNTNQSTYQTAVLNFFQSKLALIKVLKEAKIDPKTIESLNLGDIQKVDKLLQRTFNSIIIDSPSDGVALFPLETDTNSSDDKGSGKLVAGKAVKKNALLLSIGDMSGLQVQIKVSEININRIKEGMKVTATGNAFPKLTLKGYVSLVSSQAMQGNGGSQDISLYQVNIRIPHLTRQERALIHVGMTSKIQISIKEPPQIMLPIAAVKQSNNQSWVTILDKTGKEKRVLVVTGATTPQGTVNIVRGIKAGDKVVLKTQVAAKP